jgi:hypothetical protein
VATFRKHFDAKPIVVDGIRFASMREAKRYGELIWLQKARAICDLKLQPKFPCAVADMYGVLHVIGSYRGDFQYVVVATDRLVVEDAKGARTPLYAWKKTCRSAIRDHDS